MKKLFFFLALSLLFFSCGKKVHDTKKLPGDKNNFATIAAIPDVIKFIENDQVYITKGIYDIEDPQLLRFTASYVKSDGTLDLEADYEPTVHYEFIVTMRPNQKETNKLTYYAEALEEGKKEVKEQPLGSGKPEASEEKKEILRPPTLPEPGFYHIEIINPYKIKHVSSSSTGSQSSGSMWVEVHGGMYRDWRPAKEEGIELWKKFNENPEFSEGINSPVPLAEIWQKAIRAGAPENAVAVIEYDFQEGYTFEIMNTEYKYKFDLE